MADYVFYVTVSGGKFVIDSVSQQTVDLGHTITYQFDQSDNSNLTHPLRLSTTSDGTHNSGSEYTTGVTTDGTPGNAGAYTEISVTSSTPATLYYYCSNHSGMGGQVNTTASEFANTSGVALKKPILANATNKWGNYSNQNLDTIAGKLPQSFVFPTGTGASNQVLSSDGSGGTSWEDVALAPEVAGVTWYSDSSYSSVLSTSEAINIDDATYLKVTGTNLGTSGAFGASAYVQIINTTQSNAVVGDNQSGLTGCVTASSWQSNQEWRFTINPNNVSGISSGDTLKVKAVTGGGESLFGTGYVVSADPTSVTTVNSATINNTDNVGSFGGSVAGGGQDSNTKLLLNFDRTGGTDIEDSSNIGGDGHKVTATNAVIKASPFGDGKSAMFFDGSDDYLTVGTNTVFDITSNTQSFTFECWVYPTSINTSLTGGNEYRFTSLISKGQVYLSFGYESDGTIKFYTYDGSQNYRQTSSGIMKSGEWQHLALVSNSGTVSIYYNGRSQTLNSTTLVRPDQTSGNGVGVNPRIGHADTSETSDAVNGYLDEIRIVDGVAVYTGDFDVPTSRLTATQSNQGTNIADITGTATKLLIHSDKEDDASDSHHTVSLVSSATFSTSDTLSWSGSHYDLTGSKYIKVENPSGEIFEIPSSTPFCLEGWFKSNSNQSTHAGVFGLNDDANACLMLMFSSSNLPRALVTQAGGSPDLASIIGSSALSNNTWYHGAIVRQTNNDIKFYIDGAEVGSASNKSGAIKMEGADPYFMSGTRQYTNTPFDGYVQDVRLVIGSQVYSGAFTKPNGPLTTTGGAYSSTTNVDTSITSGHCKLLLSGDQGAFTDSATSGTTHAITPTGVFHTYNHGGIAPAMTWPASLKKTGSAGVYFDGTGDYLTGGTSPVLDTGDFAIDFWCWPSSNQLTTGSVAYVFDGRANGSNIQSLSIQLVKSSLQLAVYDHVASSWVIDNASHTGLTANTWNHVQLNRSSGTLKLYIDGVPSSNTDTTNSNFSEADGFHIGGDYSGGNNFTGYIDNFRISVGTARETSNFSSSLPTQIYGAFKPNTIDTITLTGSAGSGGGYVTFNNATLSGNTETTSNLPAGLSLNETEDANNTATITGDLTESPGNYSIQLVARVTSDGTDANIDPNRKQNYSHTITKGSGGRPVLFNARRYVGNQLPREHSGYGFQPDFIWVKNRDNTISHMLVDSVRGLSGTGGGAILSDSNNSADGTERITGLTSDGFQHFNSGNYTYTNTTDVAYIAWAWKAGGSPTVTNSGGQSPTSGSVMIDGSASTANLASANIYPNKMSVNTTGGFSIVTYDGDLSSSGSRTIPHGLGSAPDLIIIKRTDSAHNWSVGHSSVNLQASSGFLELDTPDALDSSWDDFGASPDANVFTTQYSNRTNISGAEYVAYCWKAKTGVSAFGSYSGTGSAGNYRTIGFVPSLLIIKRTNSPGGSWMMLTNILSAGTTTTTGVAYDPDTNHRTLYANLAGAESSGTYGNAKTYISGSNKGFELSNSNSESNASGGEYIYMAFA